MSALRKRLAASLALAAIAGLVGYARAQGPSARFSRAASALGESERRVLAAAPAFAIADATWALGNEDAVKKMLRFELDRLPDSEGAARARAFVRFGIIDSNPDGQAAVFFQACASDVRLCDRAQLIAAAEREAKARLVAPGQHLPLYLLSGHSNLP